MSTTAPTKTGDFSLARPGGVCAVTGQPIAPEETFITALRETPQGFERLDIKADAWETFDRTNVVAFWRTAMPKAAAKKKLLVDDNVLCDLLVRLGETTEPAKLCFRFVLALILMRKRLVIYENTRHGAAGQEIWTLRMKGREESFELVDPKPTDEQIANVREQLGQILNEDVT